jgi:hypothetical protein
VAPEIYQLLERLAPFLALWSCAFTLIHSARIVRRIHGGIAKVPDNALLTEAAGLPLTLLQTVAFGMAVVYLDPYSILLFLWWGPGFITVLAIVGIAKLRQRRIDWHRFRYPISYACKLYYLAYLATFLLHEMPGMIFAFSAWIINDQYEKLFMSLDADRTRRTFHDRWLFRICYPAGLLVPLVFATTPWRGFCAAYGITLLMLWSAGLWYVAKKGAFLQLPEDPSLLRNMIYFPKLRVTDAPAPRRAGDARDTIGFEAETSAVELEQTASHVQPGEPKA